MDMKPASQPEQASCGEKPKSCVQRIIGLSLHIHSFIHLRLSQCFWEIISVSHSTCHGPVAVYTSAGHEISYMRGAGHKT